MSLPRVVLVLPLGRTGVALAPYFSVSAVLHLAFFVTVILLPLLRPHRISPVDAMVTQLVAGPPAPPAPPAAAVQQQAPAPAPPPKPEPPKPKVALPDPSKKKKKEEKKPVKEPPVQPSGPPQQEAPPSPAPQPGTGGAAGASISLGEGDAEFAWYRALVASALKSHWTRPVLEGSASLVATVSFEIRRDGSVQNVSIETSSGVPAMDRSVLRAVQDSSPLPPLPRSWPESVLRVVPSFELRPGEI